MRLVPQSLAGQLILFLLAALVITQVASFVVFSIERQNSMREVRSEMVANRLVTVARLLGDVPDENQARMLRRVSNRRMAFDLTADPGLPAEAGSDADAGLAERVAARLGARVREVRVQSTEEVVERRGGPLAQLADNLLIGVPKIRLRHQISVHLISGDWLNLRAITPISGAAWIQPVLISMALMGLAMIVIVVVVIRRLTRPLRELSEAAERFGRGESVGAIPETGPREIRTATETFNRMSARLSRFVQDRMQILAAVSHDLRTPIASLRLQAELVEDEETRDRLIATLDEMQRIAEATLDLAREDAAREDTRRVDLALLVEAVCHDLSDLGHEVEIGEMVETLCHCRVVALRRALRNLIENAVRYGTRARVGLTTHAGQAVISIEDDGPGIPEADLEEVFGPFVRLEASRAAETGGVGLGLAIARSIARGHGGDIELRNLAPGLCAELRIPLI